MRIIILFDLPTLTSKDRRHYRGFKRYLEKNGYIMMQYSVYSKIVMNHSALNLQKKKLAQSKPPAGQVDILVVTEKQYSSMETLVGVNTRNDIEQTVERTVIL